MSRDADRIEGLRSDLVRAVVEATGMRETMAMPIANSLLTMLQERYAGERLYVPKSARDSDMDRVREALEAGMKPKAVCRKFGISRSTLYRMFPGGLPVLGTDRAPARDVDLLIVDTADEGNSPPCPPDSPGAVGGRAPPERRLEGTSKSLQGLPGLR